MKIISGMLKGRIIKGFDITGTRPTQDRVKESLFSMIQNYIPDSIVLDLFAGSGSLGIEALSNYSKFCYFVDKNMKAINIINENLKNSKLDNYKLLNLDYKKALENFKINNNKFDIVFLDPPYNLNCISEIISTLHDNDLLNDDALIVCEYEFDSFDENYNNLELIKNKKYGYKNIKIYKYNK